MHDLASALRAAIMLRRWPDHGVARVAAALWPAQESPNRLHHPPGASSTTECPQSLNSRTSTSRSADFNRSSSFLRNAMSSRPQRMSAGLAAKAARSCQIERGQSLAPTT